MKRHRVSRRSFLRLSALSAGALSLGGRSFAHASGSAHVAIVSAADDAVASSQPVQWAVDELSRTLARRGATTAQYPSLEQAADATLLIVVAGARATSAVSILTPSGVPAPSKPESLAIVPWRQRGRPGVLACGCDARGLMYAVLELVDRVQYGEDPIRELSATKTTAERPFNAVRAIGRPLVSDVEDKAWFYDRDAWRAYFDMLARQRVNRFHFALGFGYDTLRYVADAYLLFPYPFLLSVPGFNVRAVPLPDAERDRNLQMLRFVSDEAAAHGIDFQAGLWTHGVRWEESPKANYTIDGITPENHAAYCRDALASLLQQCPNITGVTLRTHYESGVHEGSYAFWKTIFEGVPRSGRKVEIELHAKGLDQTMIDGALSTGARVRLSPKYWAEHVGLPYHQTAIRDLELPHTDVDPNSFAALSLGSRNHTRYGYADFLREDRPYGVMYRVFPGTHKFLLWGDPVTAAAHARRFQFCGSDGAELFEPLAFKGRRGSGVPGGRDAYADASLKLSRDWEKYRYTYLLWGRLLYNPDAEPETWRRHLRAYYGSQAATIEGALGAATRILPLVTTAHLPSAAQDTYSPEFYTNQSIPDPKAPIPYGDTPAPKVFGTVSPLDPQLFATIDEHVGEMLRGEGSGKYSPIDVAEWLETLADAAATRLGDAGTNGNGPVALRQAQGDPEQRRGVAFRRAAIDIRMQVGMGRFFAAKLRSGALYAIYKKSGDRRALEAALRSYRQGRDAWSRFAEEAKAVYVADITFGPLPHQRGHWADRVAAMDADIAAMEKELEASNTAAAAPTALVQAAVACCLGQTPEGGASSAPANSGAVDLRRGRACSARRPAACHHVPPAHFSAGKPLDIVLTPQDPATPSLVRLYYRHVNQAERYQVVEMQRQNDAYRATIPASYTGSPFPLQYYFELKQGPDKAWLYPGFNTDLTNEPYFVMRRGQA